MEGSCSAETRAASLRRASSQARVAASSPSRAQDADAGAAASVLHVSQGWCHNPRSSPWLGRERKMAQPSRPARFWYQSFVHPTEQAPYLTRLQGLLDDVAGPEVRFEVRGLDPPDHLFHPLTEFRCAAQTIRNALEAESAGYDAFVIGHFQEPGLLEIRGALDIPVIGLGEATLLAALSMGRRIGLVTIDPVFIEWHERQVHAQGLDQRVAGVRAIRMDLPSFMRAFTDEAAY